MNRTPPRSARDPGRDRRRRDRASRPGAFRRGLVFADVRGRDTSHAGIGIRLAIGASPRAVLGALFARAAAQVGLGIVIANGVLPSIMTAIGIGELPTGFVLRAMLIASGGMLLTGLVACGVPARRALRIQPTEAVRYGG